MNKMKNVLKNMKDTYNKLATNDTISGMKAAMTTYQNTTRAITLHEMEKDQIKPKQGNPIVTGEELRAYFDRNALLTTDTRDKKEKAQEGREMGE